MNLDKIFCARWSGADEPRPAFIREGIPCQLTRDQLELALVQALDDRKHYRDEAKGLKQSTVVVKLK